MGEIRSCFERWMISGMLLSRDRDFSLFPELEISVQFDRRGEVITAPFVVDVRDPITPTELSRPMTST